jgi:predicted nucleotidyltransferase
MTQVLLEDTLDQLRPLFENESRVLAVFVFGSQVDGYATPRSDVDLAVLFEGDVPLGEQLALQVKIADILGRDVDLVSLKDAPLLLRHRALQGQPLFERDSIAVADLIEDTLRQYRDFAPRLRDGRAAYYESLEQDYGTRS